MRWKRVPERANPLIGDDGGGFRKYVDIGHWIAENWYFKKPYRESWDMEDSGDDEESESPPDEADSGPVSFGGLLERITEKRSESSPPPEESGSNRLGSREQTPEVDALERVRELVAQRVPRSIPDSPTNPVPSPPSGTRRLYLAVALGIAISLVVSGVVVATTAHVADTVFAPPPAEYVGQDDDLYLSSADAAYMNRIFEETSHEVAYCGLVTHGDGFPRVEIWMADTVHAGPEQVEFITSNCPDTMREVLLHTHPNGVLRLSEEDRQTLRERPERFTCVQGGPLEADAGEIFGNLACYREARSTESGEQLSRVRVVHYSPGGGA